MTRYEFRYVPLRGSTFPMIPVQLKTSDGDWFATNALVDSGASVSLFTGAVGRSIGLNIREGRKVTPSGIGGSIMAYLHPAKLKVGDEELDAEVAFTGRQRLPVNLLGRAGVFERFLVTFDEGNRKTILESVEDP